MLIVGLTGSIGMGKTTTANLFIKENIKVYDADAEVHKLYEGEAVPLVEAAFPNTTQNGKVNRQKLGSLVLGNKEKLKHLEALIHPLLAEKRKNFLEQSKADGQKFVVLDIPLLFETGADKHCDFIITVTTSAEEQRRRVLSRQNMTEQKFEEILTTQLPDAEKRRRSDFIIDTSNSIQDAHDQVKEVIEILKAKTKNA